jgi:hypothetical protein
MSIPLISRIEHAELVRRLPLPKRLAYMLISGLAITLVFAVLVLLAVALATGVFSVMLEGAMTMDDILLLAVPVTAAFMVSIGFSGNPVAESITPGDTLARAVRQNARAGLVIGFISGFFFGLAWSLAVRVGALYIELNTIFDGGIYLGEILVYCVFMALIIAPFFALFRAFTAAVGHVVLYKLAPDHVRREVT